MGTRKVDSEDMYLVLTEKGLTFDEIADMNHHRQYVLYRGSKIQKFSTTEEFEAWQASRKL